MFQLTMEEVNLVKSQNVTCDRKRYDGIAG